MDRRESALFGPEPTGAPGCGQERKGSLFSSPESGSTKGNGFFSCSAVVAVRVIWIVHLLLSNGVI